MENSTAQNTGGKADLGKRAVAAIIDGVISGIIGFIPIIGGLVGTAYMVLRDGLEFEFMDHRSIGKKLMKLRPVRLDEGVVWILLIPIVGVAALVIGIMEIVFVLKDEEGRRWGDNIANTKVIEVNE